MATVEFFARDWPSSRSPGFGLIERKWTMIAVMPMRRLCVAVFKPTERGFTLVELIVTLIVVGILALTVMPRFIGRQVFDTRGAYEAVAGSLRFARQQAVAQRRQVCVDVAASGSLAITQASAPSPGVCDGRALINPATGAAYTLAMPAEVVLAAEGATAALPVTIVFDALGQPNAAAGLRVTGDGSFCLAIEPGTGYVHAVACP